MIIEAFQNSEKLELLTNDDVPCRYLGYSFQDAKAIELLGRNLQELQDSYTIESYGSSSFKKYYLEFAEEDNRFSRIRFLKNTQDLSYLDFVFVLKDDD